MNTNHTVILGTTATHISTAIQPNRNAMCRSRFFVKFSGRQNRFRKTSTTSTGYTLCEVSYKPNGSSQVICKCRSFVRRSHFRIIVACQTTPSSCQSSTVVFIGSTVGLCPSPPSSNARSATTSAGLLPLPTSTHPLDRCPPLSQFFLHVSPLHT